MLFSPRIGFAAAVGLFFFGICPTGPALNAGSPPPPDSLARERSLVAENFVSQKLWQWQKHLKLQDWRITLHLVRRSELKPRTLGNIHWDTDTKTATLRVLALSDYSLPYLEALQDMEFTVVHELVHLQLSSLPRSEASRSAEEKAVNVLTEALLKLDRR
jgi:hypothetical protein